MGRSQVNAGPEMNFSTINKHGTFLLELAGPALMVEPKSELVLQDSVGGPEASQNG
jgi:hypothetical protein